MDLRTSRIAIFELLIRLDQDSTLCEARCNLLYSLFCLVRDACFLKGGPLGICSCCLSVWREDTNVCTLLLVISSRIPLRLSHIKFSWYASYSADPLQLPQSLVITLNS